MKKELGIEPEAELAGEFEKKRAAYFSALAMQLRREFALLRELGGAGNQANKEGWFVGHHSLVEAAVTLKLSDWMKFPVAERSVLAKAAMLHDSNKRVEYQQKQLGMAGFVSAHDQVNGFLRERGVDQSVLSAIEGTSPEFPRIYMQASGPGEGLVGSENFFNQQVLFYVDNITQTRIASDENGLKHEQTTLVNWRDRIAYFRETYPDLAKETIDIGGVPMLHFDIEEKATAEIESSIVNRILANDTRLADDIARKGLPVVIQERIIADIETEVRPRL